MFSEAKIMLNAHRHVLDVTSKVAIIIILGLAYTDLRPNGSQFAFVSTLAVGFQAFLASIYLKHEAARLISAAISINSAMSALLSFYVPEKFQWVAYLPVNLMLTFYLGGLCKWLMITICRKLDELLPTWFRIVQTLQDIDLETGPLLVTNRQRQNQIRM